MTKRLVPLLVSAAILAAGAAGCGGDDSPSLNDAKKQASDIQKQAEDAAKGAGNSADGLTKQQREDIKKKADKLAEDAGTDPDKLKKQVEDAAKSGDTEKIRKAAVDTCLKLADQIPVASQKQQAKQECRDSVK
jgi:hypothetical protein